MKFGFDLDNTIINYRESCKKYAISIGEPNLDTVVKLKKFLLEKDPASLEWNKAQSWIYTEGLELACLNENLVDTFCYLKTQGFEIEIHSHKTTISPKSSGSVKLREPMKEWLKKSEISIFLDIERDVYFYESQNLKIQGIKDSGVRYFVDDLVAVFENPNYPREIKSFLIGDLTRKKSFYEQISNFSQLQKWLEINVK